MMLAVPSSNIPALKFKAYSGFRIFKISTSKVIFEILGHIERFNGSK